jgi:hypothetical protein
MQSALKLTDQERLCFMQALNAVVRHDGSPHNVWLELLGRFGSLLKVSATDYEFQAGAPVIAEKVNQVDNPRVRVYFLRIIHDAHEREIYILSANILFGPGQMDACRIRFLPLYDALTAAIRLY